MADERPDSTETDDRPNSEVADERSESADGAERPETKGTDDRDDRDEILKRRHRRQKVLRGGRRSRFSDLQQWIFVGLALLFVLAWLVGKDSCTRKITDTYGAITNTAARDGGVQDATTAPRPMDDGW